MTARPLPRDLRRALDLLEAGTAHGRTIRELAAACRTAPRTLQKHFRSFIGSSPARFMRELRLERARKDLLCAPVDASVTQVATRHGFQHLGRFSIRYRERYGEVPSATLRKRLATIAVNGLPPPLLLRPAERPSVAVQPFELIGSHAERLRSLAEGISAALGRLRWCTVTAADRARYHVRASVRSEVSGTLRTTVFLLEARSGRSLWADHWVNDVREVPEFDARIAAHIAAAIQRALRGAEIDRVCRVDRARLDGWELSMRAMPYALSFDAALEARAVDLLEQAMESAPWDALPVALASWCHGLLAGHHFTARPHEHREAARSLASRAAQLGASDPLAEVFLAGGYTLAHDLPAATIHVERALMLDGGSAWAWGRSGWIKAYGGEPAEAIERFQIARDLARGDSLEFLWAIGIGSAYLENGNYQHAIDWYARALVERPTAVWNDRFRAAAYALAGRKEEARRTLAQFSRAFPAVTIADVKAGLPYSARFLDQVAEGLESAGMHP